jgi:hypothetical protein
MDVHHHPQQAGKRFKHYLFEFLMLFLAVFAGFIAENQREHFIEHKKEKQFIKQLLADLREDSIFFIKRIADLQTQLSKHENFAKIMMQPGPVMVKDVLDAGLPLLYEYDVQVISTTYTEMRSSGSLRYIQNPGIIISLQRYYDILIPRAISNAADANKYYSDHITPFLNKHFRVQDVDLAADTVISNHPVILNRSADTDQELLNIMVGYAYFHKLQIEKMLIPAMQKANELIMQIKREYRLQ